VLLLGLWLLQVGLVAVFAHRLRDLRRVLDQAPRQPESGWPELEVVLCLRGADACLPRLLEVLAQQTYPAPWRLQVVIDHEEDPAWAWLQPWRVRVDGSALSEPAGAPAAWVTEMRFAAAGLC